MDLSVTGEPLSEVETFGLLLQWLEVDLGVEFGGISAGANQKFVAILPIFVGYSCVMFPNFTCMQQGVYGPPRGIFILRRLQDIYVPAFGTGIGLTGLPPALYCFPLEQPFVFAGADNSAFAPSGTAYQAYLEAYNGNWLVRFQTAINFGSSALVFGGILPSSYRSYFPTQADFADGEWVYLFTDWVLGTTTNPATAIVIKANIHSSIHPLYWLQDAYGTKLASGIFYLAAKGRKDWHWFHQRRFEHFDGVITSGGWIKCFAIVQIGSTYMEYDEEYFPPASTAIRFVPTTRRVGTWVAYKVFALGSIRRRPYPLLSELVIDVGIPIPQWAVVTYFTGSPVMTLWAYDNSQRGSVLFAQACLGIPAHVDWYPDYGGYHYYDKLIELLNEFLNSQSFEIVTDACDGPFIAYRYAGQIFHVQGFEPFCYLQSNYDPTNDRVLIDGYDFAGRFGFYGATIHYERDFEGDWLSDVRRFSDTGYYPPRYGGFRFLPAWPDDLHPYTLQGLDGNLWTSMFLEYPTGWQRVIWNRDVDLSPPIPGVNTPGQDKVPVWKIPPSFVHHEVWRCSSVLIGSAYSFSGYAVFRYYWRDFDTGSVLGPEVKFQPLFAASYILQPQVEWLDWRTVTAQFKCSFEIVADDGHHGKLVSSHLRYDRIIPTSAFAVFMYRISYFQNYIVAPGGPYGAYACYGVIPTSPVNEGILPYFAGMNTLYPELFVEQQVAYNQMLPIIIGRFDTIAPVLNWRMQPVGAEILISTNNPNKTRKLVVQPNERYDFLCDSLFEYLEPIVAKLVERAVRLSGIIQASVIVTPKFTIEVPTVPWLASPQSLYLSHPASALYVGGGQLIDCGTMLEWANNRGMAWLEPIDRYFTVMGSMFFATGTFERVAIYTSDDWTIRSEFVRDYLREHPERLNWLMSQPAIYRAPDFYRIYVWNFENAFTSDLPTQQRDANDPLSRFVLFEPIPKMRFSTTYMFYNNFRIASAYFRNGSFRMIFPFEGWQRTLPAGLLKRIPDHEEALIFFGTETFLDREVVLMRTVVTMGNVPVTLYPRYADFAGRRVYYFTQDGGNCPLWMGEPIIGIDAIPLYTGEIVTYVFTARGVITFELTIDGVDPDTCAFVPAPVWIRNIFGDEYGG